MNEGVVLEVVLGVALRVPDREGVIEPDDDRLPEGVPLTEGEADRDAVDVAD